MKAQRVSTRDFFFAHKSSLGTGRTRAFKQLLHQELVTSYCTDWMQGGAEKIRPTWKFSVRRRIVRGVRQDRPMFGHPTHS